MTSLEELVQKLINHGTGDIGRLEDIISIVKKGHSLPVSDQEYLKKLLAESRKNDDVIQSKEEPKLTESYSKYADVENQSKDTSSGQTTEIGLLRKDIHKLQDRNHVIEEHLKNQANQKSGSRARAFGRGIAGIFLFLFGLGMIFVLYDFLSNINNYLRNVYYSIGDPTTVIIFAYVIIPVILLSIGGTSIYYGIRTISKT